jgi:hypothetical protein
MSDVIIRDKTEYHTRTTDEMERYQANIHASSGVIWGIPEQRRRLDRGTLISGRFR